MERIKFRLITLEDIPLMHSWFNEPNVQKFYSLRNWSEEEVFDKLLPTIEHKNKSLFGYIVLWQKKPVGYLQTYKVKDFPWSEQDFDLYIEDHASGLDLFIGDPLFTGKGLGEKILNQFLETIIWPCFEFCIADPDQNNLASIRLFEKCGFKLHKKITSKDALGNPVHLLLMIKNKSNKFIDC